MIEFLGTAAVIARDRRLWRGSSANRPGSEAAHGCGRDGRTRASPLPSRGDRATCLRPGSNSFLIAAFTSTR